MQSSERETGLVVDASTDAALKSADANSRRR
jgi:hypothetical protein